MDENYKYETKRDKIYKRMIVGNQSFIIELTFDQVYREWMQKIISFIRKVTSIRNDYSQDILNKPGYEFMKTSEAVANQFLYFLMKDEISSSNGNIGLEALCEYITEKDEELFGNFEYMKTLCTVGFNEPFVGQIYDFYISMWSCFEASINSLCREFDDMIKKDLETSNHKKILKFIKKCINDDSSYKSFINEFNKNKESLIKKVPTYVSFSDKINYLFKHILKGYSRDEKKDKEILLFCGRLRNTLHNNGLNINGDKELTLNGYVFKLEKNKLVYSEEYIKKMILINEIFDIYTEIIKSFDENNVKN
ncbi:hypothetical protein ACSXEP_07070 [Clostridium perfringens]